MKKNLFYRTLFISCILLQSTQSYCEDIIKKIEIVKLPTGQWEELLKYATKAVNIFGEPLANLAKTQIAAVQKETESFEGSSASKINAFYSAIYRGTMMAMAPLMGNIISKGSTTLMDYMRARLLNPKPEIIEPEAYPKYGRIDRAKRWWAEYKTPEVIFDQETKDHLVEIQEKTKNIRNAIRNGDKEAQYTNLLLYGPPGTGKTLFARVLADYTDMDFLPVDGTRLLQSELAFSEIVDMANHSSYGVIIFIDEADSLFLDRQILLASKAPDALSQYKALNHILGIIGQKNNKYMVVAATNNPHVLDEAMDRRFPDRVEVPLPTLATRLALLNLYIGNQLFNEKNKTKEFVSTARSLLTPDVIQEIAQKTEGFSPDKLESMIKAIRDSARGTQSGLITQKNINNAINRALKTQRETIKNKEKRAKLFEQQPEKDK